MQRTEGIIARQYASRPVSAAHAACELDDPCELPRAPRIAGTRLAVAEYQVTLSDVHAALAYYYDHCAEIDADMAAAAEKPAVFINSSSQGYYGLRDFDDRIVDENAPADSGDRWAKESAVLDSEGFAGAFSSSFPP